MNMIEHAYIKGESGFFRTRLEKIRRCAPEQIVHHTDGPLPVVWQVRRDSSPSVWCTNCSGAQRQKLYLYFSTIQTDVCMCASTCS